MTQNEIFVTGEQVDSKKDVLLQEVVGGLVYMFATSNKIINVQSQNTINRHFESILLKHAKGVVFRDCSTEGQIETAVKWVMHKFQFIDQIYISCIVPLSRCPDITKCRLRCFEDFPRLQSTHLFQTTTHVRAGLHIDSCCLVDGVGLHKCVFHVGREQFPLLVDGVDVDALSSNHG